MYIEGSRSNSISINGVKNYRMRRTRIGGENTIWIDRLIVRMFGLSHELGSLGLEGMEDATFYTF